MRMHSLMRDKISIFNENGDLIAEKKQASVQKNKVFTAEGDFPVETNYIIERTLSNGLVERYRVIEPNFYSNVSGFGDHYQMTVENIKNTAKNDRNVTHNYNFADNAKVYQDNSTDNSTNTYYKITQYTSAVEEIKKDIEKLSLTPSEREIVDKSIGKISSEVQKEKPDTSRIKDYLEFLPLSVTALDSVIHLGQMLGLN